MSIFKQANFLIETEVYVLLLTVLTTSRKATGNHLSSLQRISFIVFRIHHTLNRLEELAYVVWDESGELCEALRKFQGVSAATFRSS